MEIQIKLYKIFDKTKEDTLSKLYTYFKNDMIKKISKNIIGIIYDYNEYSISNITKILEKIDIEEIVIINEIFYNIILNSIGKNFTIKKIQLRNCTEDISDTINDCLDEIKSNTRIKNKLVKDLIYELDWVYNEDQIDILDIEICINYDDMWFTLTINRFGELLVNTEIFEQIQDIIQMSI